MAADEVQIEITIDADEHFFRAELINVVETNSDLLDMEKVRDYLSFVAPVTYSPNFYYQTEIYKHAEELNFKITEYKIFVNGENNSEENHERKFFAAEKCRPLVA